MTFPFQPATKLIPCPVHKCTIDLSDEEYDEHYFGEKWRDFVNGGNGCLYGIPWNTKRVLEYNTISKRIREIGPDLGDEGCKYDKGIKVKDGSIYCKPLAARFICKIVPKEGEDAQVCILRDKCLERRERFCWGIGVLAGDGCIYYFPYNTWRILKLDPKTDKLTLVGERIGQHCRAAVAGKDGHIYCIFPNYIIKFNYMDYSVSKLNIEILVSEDFLGVVLADDGCFYSANRFGQILKFDITERWELHGDFLYKGLGRGWGQPVLGADKCIYFPPANHDRVLKFNPVTVTFSLIGNSFSDLNNGWVGATLASDGFIYCAPFHANDFLQIDTRCVNDQVLALIDDHMNEARLSKRRKVKR